MRTANRKTHVRSYVRRRTGATGIGGPVKEHDRIAATPLFSVSEQATRPVMRPSVMELAPPGRPTMQPYSGPVMAALAGMKMSPAELSELEENEGVSVQEIRPRHWVVPQTGLIKTDGADYGYASGHATAELLARNILLKELISDPEVIYAGWVDDYTFVQEHDKRAIAAEAANSELGRLSDEEIVNAAGYGQQWDMLERLAETTPGSEGFDYDRQLNDLFASAQQSIYNDIYNQWYEGLDRQPLHFLTSGEEAYTREEALALPYVYVDYDGYTEDTIAAEGIGKHLPAWNDTVYELSSGALYWIIE